MKLAAIQLCSGHEVAENQRKTERFIQQAVAEGAELVVLPEYWPLMGMHEADKLNLAEDYRAGPLQSWMSQLAARLNIILVGGTIPLRSPQATHVYNTTLVYGRNGEELARYDKIHLFGFQKGAESYDERRSILAGQQPVSFDCELGKVVLSICYDLRFPELFRNFADTALIVLPAAFTYTTGKAHWEILLKARAIENQCFVLASAQAGVHSNQRKTWGHSMLIDPWGQTVAELADAEGYLVASADLQVLREVRQNLPALQHRQLL